MTHDDVPAVHVIETASFTTPWTVATFRSLLDRRGTGLWVADDSGEVVGYTVVWAVLDQAELGNLAVADNHRGMGVGRTLVETVLDWLAGQGVRDLYLEVRTSNAEARRLYESMGFRAVGRRPGYYSQPREDALVLRRSVTSKALTD